jgi:hypothetical protein
VREREGRYEVEPAWPLLERPPRERARRERSPAEPALGGGVRRPEAGRASLRTLLELLWRLAGFHYWQPAFAGARTYAVIVERVRGAAERIWLGGRPLSAWLYFPPPYEPARASMLAAERAAWAARLAPGPSGAAPLGYALGLWRSVEERAGRVWLRFRHCPWRLEVPAGLWAEATARWTLPPTPEAWPLLWLALVRWNPAAEARLLARELAALPLVDDHGWLPCESDAERRLIRRLVAERRLFVKPLAAGGLGLAPGERLPDVVLLDRRDRCALEVVGRMRDAAYRARWDEKRRDYERRGRAYWAWDPEASAEPPPIPPPDLGRDTRGARAEPASVSSGDATLAASRAARI